MSAVNSDIDPTVSCSACDAVCCRLTVLVMPEDNVPPHLTAHNEAGLLVMAHDEDGWCVAVDGARLNCSIYATRPAICRRFVMGGPYCRAVRDDYAIEHPRDIPLTLLH
jgi:Fe-S-cluster containining protein